MLVRTHIIRYFLHISYKGTAFHGWQIQETAHTVQAEIEQALSKILRTPTSVLGSGRTDAGVHSTGQIAHFETQEMSSEALEELRYKLNAVMVKDVAINWIRPVHPKAHARFDATFRTYHYQLTIHKSPFAQNQIAWYPALRDKLNLEQLNQLAAQFIGEKDFQSFSRVKTEVNHFRCNVTESVWSYDPTTDIWTYTITANRFLRGMVRAIVGTMIDIISGNIPEEAIPAIIEAKDRKKAGKAARPEGLYLAIVEYPESVFGSIDY